MKNLPDSILSSKLWNLLKEDHLLTNNIVSIRTKSEAIAKSISTVFPNYTDHSVRHMDMLWKITDSILTEFEIGKLSIGEAFILASSFYIHDLGMSKIANNEGCEEVKQS